MENNTLNKPKCKNCAFHHPMSEYRGKIKGQCRINPPQTHTSHHRWPMIADDDWCGSFRER